MLYVFFSVSILTIFCLSLHYEYRNSSYYITKHISGSWYRSAKSITYDYEHDLLCAYLRTYTGYNFNCIIIKLSDNKKLKNSYGEFRIDTTDNIITNNICKVSGLENYNITYFHGCSLCIHTNNHKEYCIDYEEYIKHINFNDETKTFELYISNKHLFKKIHIFF